MVAQLGESLLNALVLSRYLGAQAHNGQGYGSQRTSGANGTYAQYAERLTEHPCDLQARAAQARNTRSQSPNVVVGHTADYLAYAIEGGAHSLGVGHGGVRGSHNAPVKCAQVAKDVFLRVASSSADRPNRTTSGSRTRPNSVGVNS
jgi:hypothetical protein